MGAPEGDHDPSRGPPIMACGCEGIFDGFAFILVHDNAGSSLPRL